MTGFRSKAASIRRSLYGAPGVLALNVFNLGLGYVIAVSLTRLLGAEGYGAYNYALSWVLVLGVPALLGVDVLLVRQVASYQVSGDWSLLGGLLRWSSRVALTSSMLVTLAALGAVMGLRAWLAPELLSPLLLSLFLVPLLSQRRVYQATLQGFHRVASSLAPELAVFPVLFLAAVWTGFFLVEGLTASTVMVFNIAATLVSLLVVAALAKRHLRTQDVTFGDTRRPEWWSSILAFVFVSAAFIINSRADVLMLGSLGGAASVGVYSIAARGAELVSFFLIPASRVLPPRISRLFSQGDLRSVQELTTRSARFLLILSLPIAAILIVFGRWFLLLFGPEFVGGQRILALLCVSQLVTSVLGLVVILLTMTGHERDVAVGVGTSAALNIVLNGLFIPRWGAEGAALATAISSVLRSIGLAYVVKRRLDIDPTPLGWLSASITDRRQAP